MARRVGEVEYLISADAGPLEAAVRRASTGLVGLDQQARKAGGGVDHLAQRIGRTSEATEIGAAVLGRHGVAMADNTQKSRMFSEATGALVGRQVEAATAAKNHMEALAGLATAATSARLALAEVNKERQIGEKGIRDVAEANRNLAQIAGLPGTETSLTMLEQRSDMAAMKFGLGRVEARDLMFSAQSEGFNFEQAANAAQLIGAENAAAVSGKFRKLFPGDTFSPTQAISMVAAAAAPSPFSAGQLASVAPIAAETSSSVGGSVEETLAILSVFGDRFKSPERAANVLKSFQAVVSRDKGGGLSQDQRASLMDDRRMELMRLSDEGISDEELIRSQKRIQEIDAKLATPDRASVSGAGPIEAARRLAALTPEQRGEVLGDNQEANAAFTALLEETKKVAERLDIVTRDRAMAQQGFGALQQQRAIQESSPAFQANRMELGAAARREVEQRDKGIRQLELEAAKEQFRSQGNLIANTALGAAELVGADLPLSRLAGVGGGEVSRMNAEAGRMQAEMIAIQRRMLEEQIKQTQALTQPTQVVNGVE